MRNILALAALAMVMASCSHSSSHHCVSPLPAGVDIDSLADCTVPAQFNVADINWTDSTLTMTVYNEDLYDAVDLNTLQSGDTIVYQGHSIVVAKVADTADGLKTINDGIEQGGADLQAHEGGTYRGIQLDDHSVYTSLGKATVPIANNLVVVDCGIEPDEPSDTIGTDALSYLKQLKGGRDGFIELNTLVQIEHGKVTRITRRWIP